MPEILRGGGGGGVWGCVEGDVEGVWGGREGREGGGEVSGLP
jgi:hypothetical protein